MHCPTRRPSHRSAPKARLPPAFQLAEPNTPQSALLRCTLLLYFDIAPLELAADLLAALALYVSMHTCVLLYCSFYRRLLLLFVFLPACARLAPVVGL